MKVLGKSLLDQQFLKRLDRLALNARMAIKGDMGGNRKSRSKGSSIEFSDFREYIPGDDFRRIDWNAYARFERLFVKLFMEERQANITIFLDVSASMDWGQPNKGVLAKQLAAVFVYLALANFDRVAVVGMQDKPSAYLPYFSGKQMFWQALSFIEGLKFGGKTSLCSAVKGCTFLKRSGGISILITDLFSKDGYKEALEYLQYLKQEVMLIHVMAPQELQPELSGSLRLVDVEGEGVKDVILTPDLLKAYKRVLDEFLSDIKAFCYSRGINYVLVNSSSSMEEVVFYNLMKLGFVR